MNKREWMLQAALGTIGTGSGTAEKWTAYLSAFYDAIVAASPEPADSGWIEHRGEKPYPEGWVSVRYRDGSLGQGDADEFLWTHDLDIQDCEIIGWRPA